MTILKKKWKPPSIGAFLAFFNQMWIILKNKLGYFLLSNYMNRHLSLSCAQKEKNIFQPTLLPMGCGTSYMPMFKTLIRNQQWISFLWILSQKNIFSNIQIHFSLQTFMIMFLQQLDIDGIFPQQIIDVFGIALSPQKLIFLLS